MIPLIGLLTAAVLMAFGNLVENNTVFLAGSVVFLLCGIAYFKRG
jgi:hypothetical protein